jgi:ribosome-associated protein
MRLQVTGEIALDEHELSEHFILNSGPGGQNVNKVASAVQLRFDAKHSPSLSEALRARLIAFAGRRATKDGVVIIVARRHRTQERNRVEARERLIDLIRRAAEPEKPRRPTKPSAAAKRRRLDEKTMRGKLKAGRAKVRKED